MSAINTFEFGQLGRPRHLLVLVGLLAVLLTVGCAGDGPTTLGTGVAQLPNTGMRAFSAASYTSTQPMVISISVVPQNGSSAYAIEDLPPLGWTVSNINEGGVYDALTGKVKWGIFFDQCPLYFSYTVTPPSAEVGVQTFAGTLSVDGVNTPITGQTQLP